MEYRNKHYARLNDENIVIRFFSDAFEQPLENDICINENAERHCHKSAMSTDSVYNSFYLYEYKNGEIVDRDLTVEKTEKLRQRAIDKIKADAGKEIESETFDHDGKVFSCGVIAQTNYMGLKTAIDSGIITYPQKCWSITGEESIITDETDLKTRIGKLFSVVYPIREKANADECAVRNMTLQELEAEL